MYVMLLEVVVAHKLVVMLLEVNVAVYLVVVAQGAVGVLVQQL